MTSDNSTLPTVREAERQYIRIQPAMTQLSPENIVRKTATLHTTLQKEASHGMLAELARLLDAGGERPFIECQIVAPASESTPTPLEYYFSLGESTDTRLDILEYKLRELFPPDYQFSRTSWTVDALTIQGETADQLDGSPVPPYVAGVEFESTATMRKNWQMSLLPAGDIPRHADRIPGPAKRAEKYGIGTDDATPLATLLETMVQTPHPVVYQLLIAPFRDWQSEQTTRLREIDTGQDRVLARLLNPNEYEPGERDLTTEEQARKRAIEVRNTSNSFLVNARAVVPATAADQQTADQVATELQSAFTDLGSDYHWLTGQRRCDSDTSVFGPDNPGQQLFRRVRERTLIGPEFLAPRNWPPWRTNGSRGIIADAEELPALFAIEGDSVPAPVTRGLQTTPPAQTPLPLPADTTLEQYRQRGLALGIPIDSDGARRPPALSVPPSVQPTHAAWIGQTGTGKSTALINAILENATVTAGPDILIDPKGGQMSEELLQSLYAREGSFEDVYYFDLAEWLPAQSFFDIRDELEAGVPRETAVEDRVAHFEEVLRQLMGPDQYDSKLAPKIIRTVLRALYDRRHGDDAPTLSSLYDTLTAVADRGRIPPVSDDALERSLNGLLAHDAEVFEGAMVGVTNRIEEIANRPRLRRLFNYDPTAADVPQFDFSAYLDEDATIILDIGRLRESVQRAMVLVVLSNLWTALRQRHRRNPEGSLPLVNVYLEEAGTVAGSEILDALLSQGREFQVSMTLAMQYPKQLAGDRTRRQADAPSTYDEVLNNVGTLITGRVGHDRKLAERLATAEIDSQKMGARLRQLSAGQWVSSLSGEMFEQTPRPFYLESLPLPAGHPDATVESPPGYQQARDQRVAHTKQAHALTVDDSVSTVDDETGPDADYAPQTEIDVLAWTTRLPDAVTYDPERGAIQCTHCDRRYNPTGTGMRRALRCSNTLETVNRDDIPICDLHLTLSAEEIAAADWTPRQLAFLQAVHAAQQRRFGTHEYDIVRDSMLRLKEYLDIDQAAIDALEDAGLLRHDGDHPHRLYSITDEGRALLGERARSGLDYGHEQGDLGESSLHVLMVEALRRWLVREYKEAPDSPVVEVRTYYEVCEGELSAAAFMAGDGPAADDDEEITFKRLDVVGLDADGEIVVTAEAERLGNDIGRAAPADFDAMAACEPDEAIWAVPTQAAGHEVLEALNDPIEGDPRVEKTYSANSPPQAYTIETAGLTAMYPASWLIDQLYGTDESGVLTA